MPANTARPGLTSTGSMPRRAAMGAGGRSPRPMASKNSRPLSCVMQRNATRGKLCHAMLGRAYEGQVCSIARSLEVVGERWTLLVLRDAFLGVHRFEEF